MSSPLRLGVPEREAGRRADSLTHSSRSPTTDPQRTSERRRLKDGLANWLPDSLAGTVAPPAPGTSWVRLRRNGVNVCVGWVERRKVVVLKNKSGGGFSGQSRGWASTA